MRLLLFFDLPVGTSLQRKHYAQFRKALVKEGYLMVQKSVYSKLVLNDAAAASALERLQKIKPSEGVVQVLRVTEKQYAGMKCIVGSPAEHDEVDTIEELLVI